MNVIVDGILIYKLEKYIQYNNIIYDTYYFIIYNNFLIFGNILYL
jgi:hypothetical protein